GTAGTSHRKARLRAASLSSKDPDRNQPTWDVLRSTSIVTVRKWRAHYRPSGPPLDGRTICPARAALQVAPESIPSLMLQSGRQWFPGWREDLYRQIFTVWIFTHSRLRSSR